MTAKEYIEKMIDAFEKQGRFSIGDTDSCKCMYRTNGIKGGLKCIVGQGIDDAFYREPLERCSVKSCSVSAAINDSFNKAGGSGLLPQLLLELLQDIHDSEYNQERVPFKAVVAMMRKVATTYFEDKENEYN